MSLNVKHKKSSQRKVFTLNYSYISFNLILE